MIHEHLRRERSYDKAISELLYFGTLKWCLSQEEGPEMCLQMENGDFGFPAASFLCVRPAFLFFPASCSHQWTTIGWCLRSMATAPSVLHQVITSGYGQSLSSLVSAIKYLGRIGARVYFASQFLVTVQLGGEVSVAGVWAGWWCCIYSQEKRKECACLASFLLFVQPRTQVREWCCLLEGGSSCLKHFRLGVFQPWPSRWPLTDVPRG